MKLYEKVKHMKIFSYFFVFDNLDSQSQSVSRVPVMEWMSWKLHRGNINEQMIRNVADVVVEKELNRVGYT
jgi:hypothetical protein